MECSFALIGKGYVLVASDTSAARSIVKMKSDEDKTKVLSPHLVMTYSGEPGDTVQFAEYVERNLRLQHIRHIHELRPSASASWIRRSLADSLRSRHPYSVNLLLGGFDVAEDAPKLYWIDYLGTLAEVPFAAHGYGSYFALSLLDRYHNPEASLEEGVATLKRCIAEVQKRLIVSLENFKARVVDKDGFVACEKKWKGFRRHPMASLELALEFFRSIFQTRNATGLATVICAYPHSDDLVALRASLQANSNDAISSRTDAPNAFSSDPVQNEGVSALVRDYFRYVREYGFKKEGSYGSLKIDFKAFDSVVQRLADLYKSSPNPIPSFGTTASTNEWLGEVIKRACKELLARAREVDAASGHATSITNVSDAAARLLKILLVTTIPIVGAQATPTNVSRASTAVSIANSLFRTYQAVDSAHLFTSVVQPMRNIPPLLDRIPKSESVEYRYWLGRHKLSTGNLHHARHLLGLSFDRCLNSSKNKRRILTYLLTASILSGRLPSPILLSSFGITEYFGPISEAIRRGDANGLRRHLDQNMAWFASREILFILREKADVLIWRTICRRVGSVINPSAVRAEQDIEIPLPLLVTALSRSYQEFSYDLDDAEMTVACLIEQGYVRGGVAHSSNSIKRCKIPAVVSIGRSAGDMSGPEVYAL